MNRINPELEAQVNTLAQLCGRKLEGSGDDFEDQSRPVINTLVLGGFDRLSDTPLADRIEEAAVDQFESVAIHRRAQLRSLCERLQEAYKEHKRWHATTTPPDDGETPSRPANISANTTS